MSTLYTSVRNVDDHPTVAQFERILQFQQTIPRKLVHRAAVSEVFVTDLKIIGEGLFEVGAQWPRRHAFFGPRTPSTHDPMLFAETCRQAGLLIAHRAYDVPFSHSFLADQKTSSVVAQGLATTSRPVDVTLRISAHDVRRRGSGVGGMRLDFLCFRDSHVIGSASERWRCVAPAVFRRMRGDHFAATPFRSVERRTVAPPLVGRERVEDVLVAETGVAGTWSLQFDPEHAVLFDHAVDHLPGMVLVESARQAALLTVGDPAALPVHIAFDFLSYVEFDAECLLLVTEEDGGAADGRVVRVVFQQNGATVATGTLTMSPS